MKTRIALLAAALIALLCAAALLNPSRAPAAPRGAVEKATFAGGCYWCMQPTFDRIPGVISVTAGYAGTGSERRESVEIAFDPTRVTYRDLLAVFWKNVDPLNDAGQFCDDGSDYRSGIFVHDDAQRRVAEETKGAIEAARGFRVVTAILPVTPFLRAAEYDQNYYRKHPVRYRFYRLNCGRDARLYQIWGAGR